MSEKVVGADRDDAGGAVASPGGAAGSTPSQASAEPTAVAVPIGGTVEQEEALRPADEVQGPYVEVIAEPEPGYQAGALTDAQGHVTDPLADDYEPAYDPRTLPPIIDEAQAWQRLLRMIEGTQERLIIGIAGAPGVGKTSYAEHLATCVVGAAVVGMDAYHLSHQALIRMGRVQRKGAPDTFDVFGYLSMLMRLRRDTDHTIWAPEFRRDLEDPIAGMVPVRPSASVVFTEGNYLLLPRGPWAQVRELCDEVWFVEVPERVRVERLVSRHAHYGQSRAQARARATVGVDAENAKLVTPTRERADVIVQLTMSPDEY